MSASARVGLIGVVILLAVAVAVWNRQAGNEAAGAAGAVAGAEGVLTGAFSGAPPAPAPSGPPSPADPPAVALVPPAPVPTPESPATTPTAEPALTPAPAPAVPEPAPERTYRTRAGDTLSGIARQLYGREGLWHRIYEANRAIIPNPDVLSEGLTLVIPPGPDATTTPAAPAPATSAPAAETPTGERTYVVRDGDTLTRIAREQLGDTARVREIFERNRDRLPSPDALRAGMEIVLPRR